MRAFRLAGPSCASTGISRLLYSIKFVLPNADSDGTFDEIVQFLNNNPPLRRYVQAIHIRGQAVTRDSRCSIYTMRRATRHTPRLIQIKLSFLTWTSWSAFADLLNPLPHLLPEADSPYLAYDLKRLSFSHISTFASSPFQIMEIVSSCDYIAISGCQLYEFVNAIPVALPVIPCGALFIHNSPFGIQYPSLFTFGLQVPLPLKEIDALYIHGADYATVASVLQTLEQNEAKNTLTTIRINSPPITDSAYLSPPSLTAVSNIRGSIVLLPHPRVHARAQRVLQLGRCGRENRHRAHARGAHP